MSRIQTPQDHRRFALMAAIVGAVFLIVGLGKTGDWRGIVSIAAGFLWLLSCFQHLRKARLQEPS